MTNNITHVNSDQLSQFSSENKDIYNGSEDELPFIPLHSPKFGSYTSPSNDKRTKLVDLCREDQQRIASLVNEIIRIKAEKNQLQCKTAQLVDENKALANKVEQLKIKLEKYESIAKAKERKIEVLTEEKNNLQEVIKKNSKTLNSVGKLQSIVDKLVRDHETRKKKIENANKEKVKLVSSLETISIQKKIVEKKYELLKAKYKSVQNDIKILESKAKRTAMTRESSIQTFTNVPETVSKGTSKGNERRPPPIWEDAVISQIFFSRYSKVPKEVQDLFFTENN